MWLKNIHKLNANHKRVARIMTKYGLNAKVYRAKRFTGIAQATYRYKDIIVSFDTISYRYFDFLFIVLVIY